MTGNCGLQATHAAFLAAMHLPPSLETQIACKQGKQGSLCCCRGMLKEKRREVGDKAGKLKGGLQKLQETGEQVATMQVCQTQSDVPCMHQHCAEHLAQ